MKASLITRKRLLLVLAIGLVLFLFSLALKVPTNNAQWQTQFRVLPTVELNGDTISIENVRDFRYTENDRVTEVRYLDQQFQLSEFVSAWYGISHFGGNGLAHVLMSFEFSGDKFLVVSIEARLREEDIDGYSPIKGLFRGYEKNIVLATEQDVIGLRTHVRKEPFYLYKLDVPELYTKPLLLNFLREAQVLTRKPTFYNTFIDNCMTGLLAQSDQFRGLSSWLDTRILLPGNSDEIAYELEYIDTSRPFAQVRTRALVEPNVTKLDDPNFSLKIRKKSANNSNSSH